MAIASSEQSSFRSVEVEQLRLILRNVGTTIVPGFFVIALLAAALLPECSPVVLMGWGAAAMLPRILLTLLGRRILASVISEERRRRLVWQLVVFHLVHGAIWGSLAWLTLDAASTAGSVLVIAMLIILAGSSMSLFSPVLPVYLAFSLSMLVTLAAKLWLMEGGDAYKFLSLITLSYVYLLIVQGRNTAANVRGVINLRFENLDLVERLRMETESARAAHRAAEQANLAKSKFLAAASHDLRQPLHAVNLLIEVLRHEPDRAKAAEMVEQLGISAQGLEELLNELLDMSKLEAGLFQPEFRTIDLQQVFVALERELRPVADEKGIELGFVATRARVLSDPQMLMRILRNIVTNAIRYTEHGSVLVGCRRRSDGIAIAIYDTGPGIAPEHQKAIFREFYQLGNPERDRRKGLGLGLAIVDGLCGVLGHKIELKSTVGRGTAFFVLVPTVNGEEPQLPTPDATYADLDDCAVLVIDDEPAVRHATMQVLARWGCRSLAAESASEALDRLKAEAFEPDVIVADYRLKEGRTGVEAIDEVRRALGRHISALIVTGDTAPACLVEASASGLLLLHKPMQPARLRAALASLRTDAQPSVEVRSSSLQASID